MTSPTFQDRARGVLLGGAVGDALGAPVEFLHSADALARALGDAPPSTLPTGKVTDDTQMTLFTAEALIRNWVRGTLKGITDLSTVTYFAYLRWYATQGYQIPANAPDFVNSGWLITEQALWSQRAPGNTCLSSLGSGRYGSLEDRINDSMGCGGVMRVAPIGLMYDSPPFAFDEGCSNAALTHGHRNGIDPAGALAMLIGYLCQGWTFDAALTQIIRRTADQGYRQPIAEGSTGNDTADLLIKARDLASGPFTQQDLTATLGEGWVGHEALAIAIACVLAYPDPATAIWRAAYHPGDSDSTASIAGQILGAIHGGAMLPVGWLSNLELKGPILRLADTITSIHNGTANAETLSAPFPGT